MQNWDSCLITVAGVQVPTLKCFEIVFSNILTVSVSLAIFALFVMLLVGGFRYLTAGGDQKAATGAQQTMTYAVLGIGLMAVAYLIFRIIEVFTGVTITKFVIPS
jgi:LPXTG-motif cell wall-anchored protein